MTTVILSPPSGSANSSTTVPATTKNVLMNVAVDGGKETPVTDTDSPTSTAVDLALEGENDVDVEPEEEQEDDAEHVEGRTNSVSSESAIMAQEQRPYKKRRRVSFECADIVEFEPTVYTTSVTSGGVPVGLSLNERSRSRRRLDSFEMERADERVGRQNYMEEGYLDPQEREIILNNAGCGEPVIASVEAEVNAIIQHRRESNEIDFDFMYGDDEMEDNKEGVEELEEEEVEVFSVLFNEKDEAEEEEESQENEGNSVGEDAVMRENISADLNLKRASSETTVDSCSDNEPEAASI